MFTFERRLILTLSIIFVFTSGYSQYYDEEEIIPKNEYLPIYDAVKEKASIDPLIQNGIFYDNPYYNAKGHPYIGNGRFGTGSIIFRDKWYDGINMKFDIYNQQVIIGKRSDNVMQMNLLENEFITEFTIDTLSFIKAAFEGDMRQFYQVVAVTDTISCYNYWYKSRLELQEPGKPLVSDFSDQKRRNYILMEDIPYRYKNNRTFIKIFPKSAKNSVKNYLKRNNISVDEADEWTMKHVVHYCNGVLYKEKRR